MHISNTPPGIGAICYKPREAGAGTHNAAVPVMWSKRQQINGTTNHDSN